MKIVDTYIIFLLELKSADSLTYTNFYIHLLFPLVILIDFINITVFNDNNNKNDDVNYG